MSADGSPATERDVESITPERLKEGLDSREDGFILDVRSQDDLEEWHIQREHVEIVNHPYFQLLNGIPQGVRSDLRADRKITVLCAKGGSSEMIAENIESVGFDGTHLERGMKGWAAIYEYTELDLDTEATIAQYQRPSSGCLAYLVVSDGEAALIDPLRAFTDDYVQDTRALGGELTYALDTHIHADHVSGSRDIAEQTDGTAVVPAGAAARGLKYDRQYDTVEGGDALTVGDIDIDVLHTPGHTTGMTAYKVENVLFTGDGLFTESGARPDIEDPDAAKDAAKTLYKSLTETVLAVPEETIIAPAHFSASAPPNEGGTYAAVLGELRTAMDPLSMNEASFITFIVSNMPPRPAN